MNITVPHQTLLVTVGPSLSGKSTAAEAIQNLVNAKYDHTRGEACAVVSSDDSRRQLLGNGAHKYDTEMIHASEQAFELLHEKVDRLMRYPIAKPLIIVDSTALNEGFRVRLRKQAEAHGYDQKALIFDYDLEDYPSEVSEVTKRHRRKMKRQMGDITTSHWSAGTHKITDAEDLAVTGATIEGMETKEARYVEEPEDRAFIIGDVHGCYEELLELLDKNGYETEEKSFVADIDAGSNTFPPRRPSNRSHRRPRR
jgi:predicted kinase